MSMRREQSYRRATLFCFRVCIGLILSAVAAHADAQLKNRTPLPQERLPAQTDSDEGLLPPLKPSYFSESTSELGIQVFVREYAFVGNTVFNDATLQKIVEPYAGRKISSVDLESARQALSLFYAKQGYVNSGAVLEDQDVGDVIVFRIIEGNLSELEISGLSGLNESFVQERIDAGRNEPLNIDALREDLLILRENPNVEYLHAEMRPGSTLGSSVLDLVIEEASPYHFYLDLANDRSPGIGAETLTASGQHTNVTGVGDTLSFSYGILEGNYQDDIQFSQEDNWSVFYEYPLWGGEWVLFGGYQVNNNSIVEEPLASVGIESENQSTQLGIRYHWLRSLEENLSYELNFERQTSRNFLDGVPFSFAPGSVDGEANVSVIRTSVHWRKRSQKQVLAARLTASFGVDVLDATDDGTNRDSEFVSILGQFQFVRRLTSDDVRFVFRSSMQWTSDPLLASEQFSLGGRHTVRGYRENQFVRDMGVIGNAELHIPIYKDGRQRTLIQLIPFLDIGAGWNRGDIVDEPHTLSSLGVGAVITPIEDINIQVYWGHTFRDLNTSNGDNLQEEGIHFAVTAKLF